MEELITVQLAGSERKERFCLRGLTRSTIAFTFGLPDERFYLKQNGVVFDVNALKPNQIYTLHLSPGTFSSILNFFSENMSSKLSLHLCTHVLQLHQLLRPQKVLTQHSNISYVFNTLTF